MKTRLPFLFLILAVAGLVAPQASAQSSSGGGGVVEREVHFYSEGVLCYGKLFLPQGFSDSSKVAAVVLAPGARQTAASLEKYADDIAAHGMLAMTFDYRGWGKSGGFLYSGETVRWDDRLRFSQTTTKMRIRRKRLEPQLQALDIRNAMTYVQGEAGVDRARIGVWGSDLSGGEAIVVAATDARVKAIVAQFPTLDPSDSLRDTQRKAFAPTVEQQATMIKLARSGAAPTTSRAADAMSAEESKLALAEYHPFWYLEQIPATTAVRFVVAEKNADAGVAAAAAAKLVKGAVDLVRIPVATQALDDHARDIAIHAAAEWFAKSL